MYLVITINIDVYVCLSLSPFGMDSQSPIQCETVHTIKIHFAHLRFYYLFNSVDCWFRWCPQFTMCTSHIICVFHGFHGYRFNSVAFYFIILRLFHERRNRRFFHSLFLKQKKQRINCWWRWWWNKKRMKQKNKSKTVKIKLQNALCIVCHCCLHKIAHRL